MIITDLQRWSVKHIGALWKKKWSGTSVGPQILYCQSNREISSNKLGFIYIVFDMQLLVSNLSFLNYYRFFFSQRYFTEILEKKCLSIIRDLTYLNQIPNITYIKMEHWRWLLMRDYDYSNWTHIVIMKFKFTLNIACSLLEILT